MIAEDSEADIFFLLRAFAASGVKNPVHVVRTGREAHWLWIILGFQPLGGLIYFLTNVLPDLVGG